MKVLCFVMALAAFSIGANAQVTTLNQADQIDPELDAAIRQLIAGTGALEIGEQFANAISMQMAQSLRRSNSDVPPETFSIVQEEVMAVINEELANGSFENLIVPVYAKYFTLEEVLELLAFYRTPIGQKTVEVMPLLTQESMQVGQSWGIGIGPIIGQRVSQRLAAAGIELD